MKTKKSVIALISMIVGFAVGIMVGITLTNPGLSMWEAAGTIGRIDQYRNVRITEADIELRNQLLDDENMLEAYRNYLAYEYASNVKMADDIRFALEAGREHEEFFSANAGTLAKMEEYGEFLDNARLRILEALTAINDLSEIERVAIRTVLNNAGNAMAQTVFRSSVLFDFLTGVERYYETVSREDYPRLAIAHDQLYGNLLTINIVNDNRPVLEHLLAKNLMDELADLSQLSADAILSVVVRDIERIGQVAELESHQLEAINQGLNAIHQMQFYILSEQELRSDLLQSVEQLDLAFRDFPALRDLNQLNQSAEMLHAIVPQ